MDKKEKKKMATAGLFDLFYFSKNILGFSDLTGLHEEMCVQLVENLVRHELRHIKLEPRGHFKTTIYAISFPIWIYLQSFYGLGVLAPLLESLGYCGNGGWRTLIACASDTNACKRILQIENIFDSNSLFRELYPNALPDKLKNNRWSASEASLPRDHTYLESTFEAAGVGTKITGRHYNLVVKDDLIGEESLGSDGLPTDLAIKEAIQWHEYSEALFESPEIGIDIIVGTRWGEDDVYGYVMKTDQRYVTSVRGVFDENGEPIFKERFSKEYLHKLKERNSYLFACQYLNSPADESVTELQLSLFNQFDLVKPLDGDMLNADLIVPLGQIPVSYLNRFIIVDPACSKKSKADHTGMVVLGMDWEANCYLLDLWEGRMEPEPMLRQMIRLAERWGVKNCAIESVAAQRVFKAFGEYLMKQEGHDLRIIEVKPSTKESKQQRIRGLVNPAVRGKLFICSDVYEVIKPEIKHFPATSVDHLIDAWAYYPNIMRKPVKPPEWRRSVKKVGKFAITWKELFSPESNTPYPSQLGLV